MSWKTAPRVAYVPRPRRRVTGTLILAGTLAACLFLAGPAAAALLHLATILLTVALIAGAIAFAALRIGAAPHIRAPRPH